MLKQKARSRLKNKQTVKLKTYQKTQLKLKPIKKTSPVANRKSTLLKKTPVSSNLFRQAETLGHKLKKSTQLKLNFKLFSLSLLLYFFLFIFLDQVNPEKIANLLTNQTYLPFHLVLFSANTTLLASFFSLENSLLTAFWFELVIFFKLQGFLVDFWLVASVTSYVLLIKLVFILIRKLRLVRRLKTLKLQSVKPRRKKRRRKPSF